MARGGIRTLAVVLALSAAALDGQRADSVHRISVDGEDFSDLAFLEHVLEGARIVQLGENGHGAGESMQARARIARFLHRELGFSVLAFESSLFICHLADLGAATRDPQRTLTSSVIGVWHTAEMLPLFEYLRETRNSSSALRLAGFDVQPIGGNRKQRPTFFSNLVAAIDPEYATTVQALDAEFLAAYDTGGSGRRTYLRAHADRLAGQYEALAAFIERHMSALQQSAGREAPLVAAQEARSAAAYVRFQTAPDMRAYTERRDRGMFENLRFLAERMFPGQKIVVWGHNYHLRHENEAIPAVTEIFPGVAARTMGTWTRERFGRRVFTIGEYVFEGEAVDNGRTPYTIARAAEGSLERRLLEATRGAASIVELRAAAAPPWARTVLSARYNGQQEQMLTPASQYDAILFLPRVSPPKFLY